MFPGALFTALSVENASAAGGGMCHSGGAGKRHPGFAVEIIVAAVLPHFFPFWPFGRPILTTRISSFLPFGNFTGLDLLLHCPGLKGISTSTSFFKEH